MLKNGSDRDCPGAGVFSDAVQEFLQQDDPTAVDREARSVV